MTLNAIQATTIHLNQTTFLHLGKAGGGAVTERLNEWEIAIGKQCHPWPCPSDLQNPNTTFLIDIRDPVDRYFSAFNWRNLMLCNPRNRTRTKARGKRVFLHPEKFCRPNFPKESIMLHEKYKSNASLLAEALCEPGDIREEAKRDFRLLSHAKDSISDWLPRDTWQRANLVSVVLESGFNYLHQLDSAIEWLVSQTYGATVASQLAARKHKELLHQTTDEVHMHSSSLRRKQKESLTPLGSCCMARHLKQDYELIQNLKSISCKGMLSNVCEVAFMSILKRREALLDDSVSCSDLVESLEAPNKTDLDELKKMMTRPRLNKLVSKIAFDDELFWILVGSAILVLYICRRCSVLQRTPEPPE
jgi:hypothetical protein